MQQAAKCCFCFHWMMLSLGTIFAHWHMMLFCTLVYKKLCTDPVTKSRKLWPEVGSFMFLLVPECNSCMKELTDILIWCVNISHLSKMNKKRRKQTALNSRKVPPCCAVLVRAYISVWWGWEGGIVPDTGNYNALATRAWEKPIRRV